MNILGFRQTTSGKRSPGTVRTSFHSKTPRTIRIGSLSLYFYMFFDDFGTMIVSENPVSEDLVSENPVSEDLVSENPVSEDLVSEDPVSEDLVSGILLLWDELGFQHGSPSAMG